MNNTTTATARKFAIAYSAVKSATYDIHAHGCSHVAGRRPIRFFERSVTAASAEQIIDTLVADMAHQGWKHEDLRVMGCCARAPKA